MRGLYKSFLPFIAYKLTVIGSAPCSSLLVKGPHYLGTPKSFKLLTDIVVEPIKGFQLQFSAKQTTQRDEFQFDYWYDKFYLLVYQYKFQDRLYESIYAWAFDFILKKKIFNICLNASSWSLTFFFILQKHINLSASQP